MPCDSIQYQSIDFTNAIGHEDILADALRTKGYTVNKIGKSMSFYSSNTGKSGTYNNGSFTTAQGTDLDEVKREFGRQAVKHVAKKFGWTVSEKNGTMQVRKRQ